MRLVKLLLTDNVDNLGIVGDVVEVRPGYARNFLLPRGIGTTPTPGNIQRLAARRAVVEKEMAEHRKLLEATMEKLKGHEITMMRSANEQGVLFGGVSQHEIAQALRDEGLTVEDRAVRIGTVIKRLDTYTIPIALASDLKTEIKLWVVSDKPAEQLETQAAPAAEVPAEGTEAKPKKKSKKAAAEDEAPKAQAAAETSGDEEKPKKKAKKTKAQEQA